ncbi:hypothetical protein [Maridesulfovibrio sp.]|uniref:hypothetical protein n=1 Tax=Maridesulfovibrio sp. TaxID=2795000 RepID=UPI0039EF7D28
MQNLNAEKEKFVRELIDSNNKESVNFVSGPSEFTGRSIKESVVVSSKGTDYLDDLTNDSESSDILDELLAESNSDSEEDFFDEDDDAGFYGFNEMMSSSVENGKSHLEYYPPRGFELGESRATMEIIPVNGTKYGAETSPSGIQNENVVEGRTEESESVVQSQQPAPPVYENQKQQNVQKSNNPFAVYKSASDESATQPVQQPNSTETAIGAGNAAVPDEVKSVSEEVQKKSTKPEEPAVQKKSRQDLLSDFAVEQDLYVNQDGIPFASIPRQNRIDAVEVESADYSKYLSREFRRKYGVSAPDLKNALRDSSAVAEDAQHDVYNRFHYDGETLLLDLNNPQDEIVIANKHGWNVVPKGDYRFSRYSDYEAYPTPDPNGNIVDIFEFLNIDNELDQIVMGAWITSIFRTDITRPICALIAPTGSGKSVTSEFIRRTVDPVRKSGISAPTSEQNFATSLSHNKLPTYDNMGIMKSAEMQNHFCRAVTGETIERRSLYTNNDIFYTSFKTPILLTAIEMPFSQNDLIGRTFSPFLPKLSKEKKLNGGKVFKSEKLLNAEFAKKHASILGGILNVFSSAMRYEESLDYSHMSRVGDFCTFGAAVTMAMGFPESKFVEAWDRAIQNTHGSKLSDNPILSVLVEFLKACVADKPTTDGYEFQMSVLLKKLKEFAKTNTDIGPNELPDSVISFAKKLRAELDVLEHTNWLFSERKIDGRSYVTFSRKKRKKK